MNYELDWENIPKYKRNPEWMTNLDLVKVLTGIPIHEIALVSPGCNGWRGQDFKKVFIALGFNTSERFEKFDPITDKPVLMRASWTEKKYWSGWIYYDGKVNDLWTLEEFAIRWPDIKITSMLKVWL